MGLQIDMASSPIGMPITGAYCRITRYMGDKNAVRAYVAFWINQAARLAESAPIEERHYDIALSSLSGDIVPAMYDHLKTLGDFAGAIDG
jgi:hypothetical protein